MIEEIGTNEAGLSQYKTSPIKIAFVGPRGSGKTSLMAAMYNELHNMGVSDLVAGDSATSDILDTTLIKMKSVLEATDRFQYIPSGIGGSADKSEFTFIGNAQKNGRDFYFPFVFTDMPGGWYTDAHAFKEDLDNVLKEAVVSFLTIDAPAIMEGGSVHETYNRPNKIREVYFRIIKQLKANDHAVVIVLSRCEKFVRNEPERERLIAKVSKEYGPLIDKFKEMGIKVIGTWVETLGGAQFSEYEETDVKDPITNINKKVPRFKKYNVFAPKNCSTPLMLALKEGTKAISNKFKRENEKNWLWVKLMQLLGINNNDLAEMAANNLACDLSEKLKDSDMHKMFEL